MTDTRVVRKFAWHGFVSGDLVRNVGRDDLVKMLRRTLESQAEDAGYEPLPDTFEYRLYSPTSDDAWRFLPEERDFCRDRDLMFAMTWLRCYSIEVEA